ILHRKNIDAPGNGKQFAMWIENSLHHQVIIHPVVGDGVDLHRRQRPTPRVEKRVVWVIGAIGIAALDEFHKWIMFRLIPAPGPQHAEEALLFKPYWLVGIRPVQLLVISKDEPGDTV